MVERHTTGDHPVANRIAQMFLSWPGVALTVLPMTYVGKAMFRGGSLWVGVAAGVGWFIVFAWVLAFVAKRSERDAMGLFLLGTILAGLGFVIGMLS